MEIVWRPIALEDLEQAWRYIIQNNPRAADRIHENIITFIERLAETPHLGKPGRVEGTREHVIPYTPYIVMDKRLQVLSIMHTARQWPDHF